MRCSLAPPGSAAGPASWPGLGSHMVWLGHGVGATPTAQLCQTVWLPQPGLSKASLGHGGRAMPAAVALLQLLPMPWLSQAKLRSTAQSPHPMEMWGGEKRGKSPSPHPVGGGGGIVPHPLALNRAPPPHPTAMGGRSRGKDPLLGLGSLAESTSPSQGGWGEREEEQEPLSSAAQAPPSRGGGERATPSVQNRAPAWPC